MAKGPNATGRKPQTVFSLDSPYTTPKWPDITAENQEVILELLCDLLAPIGQHRSTQSQPSNGKRSKKRKRRPNSHVLQQPQHDVPDLSQPECPPAPSPLPALSNCLTVGFNSTMRHLEPLAQKSRPSTLPPDLPGIQSTPERKPRSLLNLTAIFIPRSSQPSPLHTHIPLLTATASLASTSSAPICLVTLPKGAEARLSAALALPRVGFIGLMDGAPHATPLVEYIRAHVPDVEVPWLKEAVAANYLPLKVNAVQTSARIVREKPEDAERSKIDPSSDGGANGERTESNGATARA